jgi:hypothetical protein
MADANQSRFPYFRKTLTAERLREVVSYNAESGVFTRLDRFARPEGCGSIARRHRGHVPAYRLIGIDGEQYAAHRLAWLHFYGEWPKAEIDHINGDGLDNKIANLRLATPAQNRTNALAQKSSKTGFRGVHYHPGARRYRAQICKNNKVLHLGYYDTPEEAHAAYLKAAHEIHGEFVRWPPQRMAGL